MDPVLIIALVIGIFLGVLYGIAQGLLMYNMLMLHHNRNKNK